MQSLIIEFESPHDPGAEIFGHDIGGLDQTQKSGFATLVFEIQRDRLLPCVGGTVTGAHELVV